MKNTRNFPTKVKSLTQTAMFAAIIFVATAFLPRLALGAGGYLHIGDAFIYLSACFLPLPYAIAAAAIGGSLADLLSGYAIWVPFTFIIKALLVIAFTNKTPTLLSKRNLWACVIALPITTFGYYFAGAVIAGNFVSPKIDLLPNFIQAAGSAIIFAAIAAAFDRIKPKS